MFSGRGSRDQKSCRAAGLIRAGAGSSPQARTLLSRVGSHQVPSPGQLVPVPSGQASASASPLLRGGTGEAPAPFQAQLHSQSIAGGSAGAEGGCDGADLAG